ncbi:HEAT repeat domain-containing protein, partial [uncultured Methanofollis sp.]|uniref:HEAT repeat domain-containing protein n=1 Tax=uncultured Methanofollis sp. TaxID=262500 RepID=UPI00260D0895
VEGERVNVLQGGRNQPLERHISCDRQDNVALLIAALRDSRKRGERDRTGTLLVLEGARAVEPLINVLHDPDPDLLERVIGILGQIGDRRAVKPLIQCLKNPAPRVRVRAVQVLGGLGDIRARPEVVRLYLDNNPQVRRAAETAVWKLSDQVK